MPELGSREWYELAIADVRGVWEGAPPGVSTQRPHVNASNSGGGGVNAQRHGVMCVTQIPSMRQLLTARRMKRVGC